MHVAIIGGGLGGIVAAVHLRKLYRDAQITLIEPKNYIEIPWASIRALFDPDIATGCTFPIAPWAEKHKVVHKQNKAIELTTSRVVLADGDVVKFDFCIIATGSMSSETSLARPAQALDVKERRKEMAEYGKQFLNAKHVLVIGGGAVGTEFATDIADFAQQQGKKVKVTLVHSGDHLVPEFNQKAADRYKQMAEALGVKVVLKQKANKVGNVWKLQDGQVIDADVVVNCVGAWSQNDFVKIEGAVNEKGWLVVDQYWRVEGGQGKVWAVGDCCDSGLTKAAFSATANAAVVARNLSGKLKERKVFPDALLVTAGSKAGVAMTPLGVITRGLPWIKNRTMFLFKARFELAL